MIEFNLNSAHHLNALLFGRELIEEIKVENGITKKEGKIKFKKVKQLIKLEGLIKPLATWIKNKNNNYTVDEKVLKTITSEFPEDSASTLGKKICEKLLEIRGLQKQLSTYYNGVEERTYKEDSCVHQNYINVLTDTGRLSCSNPNVQNQPKPPKEVTKHFTSRFINGKIVAADYKALEPRVEAELCGDKTRIDDIIMEVDDHIKNLALAEKKPYGEVRRLVASDPDWKAKRSKIKGFTFSQQYLSSAQTSANNSGLTVQECEALMEARKLEYPDLYKWHEINNLAVNSVGFYKSPFKQLFKFKKFTSKKGFQYYSRNDISNYMTQGTGWLLVDNMLGRFWRIYALYNRDKYLMINTVHDNLMLDCKNEFIDQAKKELEVLTEWKQLCYTRFSYEWKVPILIDIRVGDSWYDCF